MTEQISNLLVVEFDEGAHHQVVLIAGGFGVSEDEFEASGDESHLILEFGISHHGICFAGPGLPIG